MHPILRAASVRPTARWPRRCQERSFADTDSSFDQVCELCLQFYSNPSALQLLCCNQRGSRAGKGIQDDGMLVACDLDASAGKSHGHDSRMIGIPGKATGRRGNIPHRTQATIVGATHGVNVVVVRLAFREQEDGLVGFGRSIPDRLRLGVGLVPNDLRPKPPASLLKQECNSPWHANEVLCLQSLGGGWAHRHGSHAILAIGRSVSAASRSVHVPNVQPNRAVAAQHSP